ncbi:hypothetical protein [Pelagibacterium xiamenense]|uniref:hypothetical protein n=1 Tax=Pelagibacterium xiamenense TaxID=2901140 RepID=UPI001E360380|nr:hypothetical protein [Pelagibacterium xiamenense]MCD7058446.1 hypothetical protein [Pelagibacterium xiamenense]
MTAPAGPLATKRFPWWVYILVLAIILLFALAPVGSVVVAGALAETHGCTLNEGNIHPCIIGGTDWGPTLYGMFVMGWFMLVTLPMGFFALLAWLAALIIHLFLYSRRARKEAP